MRVLLVVVFGCTTAPAKPAPKHAIVKETSRDPLAILENDEAVGLWDEAAAALDPNKVPRDVGTRIMLKRIAAPTTPFEVQCAIAYALVDWDPETGERVAEPIMRKAIVDPNIADQAVCIGMLADARAHAKSPSALADYAAWIVTIPPKPKAIDDAAFAPFHSFPEEPAIERAAATIFAEGSPWLAPENREWFLEEESHWIDFSALNKHIIKALGDRRGGGDSRVCDVYASLLARFIGAPEFHRSWSEHRRDAALVEMKRWVREQLGNHTPQPRRRAAFRTR